VWSSSCGIIKLWDSAELDRLVENLPKIRRATENLDLGGALYPNSAHLKFAIQRLEYHESRAGCLCQLYPQYSMSNPQKEDEAGHVRIDSREEENGMCSCTCTCTTCGTKFRVEEHEGHFTWWNWEILEAA
jgi:hypothetical protein